MQERKMVKRTIHRRPAGIWTLYGTFYLDEYQNIDIATKTIDKITKDTDQLNYFPELEPPLSSIADVESSCRFLFTGYYLSFYHIEGNVISIDRVLYGRRDHISILFGAISDEGTP